MNLPDNTITKHFFDTLNGNLGTGVDVYTGVPKGADYPYVLIYDQTGSEDSCKDTWIIEGNIVTEVVYGYKGDGSVKQCNTVANLIIQLLRATITGAVSLTGFNISNLELLSSNTFIENQEENKIYRKILRFNYRVEQI